MYNFLPKPFDFYLSWKFTPVLFYLVGRKNLKLFNSKQASSFEISVA